MFVIARSRVGGLFAATLAAVCWGAATVMSKAALDQLPPILLLVVQLVASNLFLWAVVWLRRLPMSAIRDAWRVAWLGLLEPGLAFLLSLLGLALAPAVNATLIASLEALIIAVLSALLLGERLSATFMALSAIAVAGLIVALGLYDGVSGTILGNSLVLLGTAVAALYVVLTSRFIGNRDPLLVVACQQLVAGLMAMALLPFESVSVHEIVRHFLSRSSWVLALGSGLVQYALAFTLYLAAMRFVSTSLLGAFLYLTPIVGLLGAVLVLGERLSPVQWAGAMVTIAALVALSQSGPSRTAAAE